MGPQFLTIDEMEQQATARINQAERLPPGDARRHALRNAAQLRSHAAMKRLFLELLKSHTDQNGFSMEAIDRVTRAYADANALTVEQSVFVREELTKCMAELMAGEYKKSFPPNAAKPNTKPSGNRGKLPSSV